MHNQLSVNSLGFTIANYQLSCSLEDDILKIKTMPNNHSHRKFTVSLMKMVADDSSLEIWVKSTPLPTHTQEPIDDVKHLGQSSSSDGFASLDQKVSERLEKLQFYIRELQGKVMNPSDSQKQLKRQKSLGKNSRNNSKKSLSAAAAQVIRESEENEFVEMIEKQVQQNAKLQMLNDLLQQKMLHREGDFQELQKRLLQRQELIRELADKLITANQQKQDIFNEYQKILQNTVFLHTQESPMKPGMSTLINSKGVILIESSHSVPQKQNIANQQMQQQIVEFAPIQIPNDQIAEQASENKKPEMNMQQLE